MVLKIISATEIRSGTTILIDGEPYTARSNDISKTGKHGASKCRIEAIGLLNGKKKVLAVPGHERFDVPNIEKRRAQLLSVSEKTASVMDMESYESFEVPFQEELKNALKPEKQVEVWEIEGIKTIMRVL